MSTAGLPARCVIIPPDGVQGGTPWRGAGGGDTARPPEACLSASHMRPPRGVIRGGRVYYRYSASFFEASLQYASVFLTSFCDWPRYLL